MLFMLGCQLLFQEEYQMYFLKHQTWTIMCAVINQDLTCEVRMAENLLQMYFMHQVFSLIYRKVYLVELANGNLAQCVWERMWF